MAKFEEMVVIDTHKGDMVAKYIARYLSENPCCTHENICRVLESFPRQSCNFLIFALLWFKKLKQIKKPDYQFKASVELANAVNQKLGAEINKCLIKRMKSTSVKGSYYIDVVDGANEIDTAEALINFLSWKTHEETNYNAFIKTMFDGDPIVLQSFTRLIMKWCQRLDNKYSIDSKSEMVVLARAIYSCNIELPYIC